VSSRLELARQVARRAQRSIYLLQGLRSALKDMGREDLVAVLDLVDQDAQAAWVHSTSVLEDADRTTTRWALGSLRQLAQMGGPQAAPVALRLARRLNAGSVRIPSESQKTSKFLSR
jgi:hypothetical protein